MQSERIEKGQLMAGLKIGNHFLQVPVIQGGMGVGVSLHRLAGSVAACGGAGIISTAQIGFREPDFDQNPLEANLRAIGKEIEKARQLAPKGVIGVNIMVATRNYEAYVKAAVKAGADLIISGAGLPMTLPAAAAEAVKEMGQNAVSHVKTALAPIVSGVKSADVICKYWLKKYRMLPDLVVIEGPLAGGHLGFKREELDDIPGMDYDRQIRDIISCVQKYADVRGTKIPIAVAGGIYDGEDVKHALLLGADAVQSATRFVTTYECDASDAYKQTYINAGKEDIVIVKSPVGMPGRAIKNRFIERSAQGQIPHGKCHACISTCKPAETPYCITEALVNAVTGNVDDGLLFCGSNAYRAKGLEHVREIMEEYKDAAEAV